MNLAAALTLLALQVIRDPLVSPEKGSPEQRAHFEQVQDRQTRFEQRLFVEAGFEPLADVAAYKRTVKRVLFHDPYMMLPVPGIEVERLRNGSVTLKVIARGSADTAVPLPAMAWARLVDLQGMLFRPEAYVPWDPLRDLAPPPLPPPICHGWIVRFGTTDRAGQGSGSWTQCGGGANRPERAFAAEMARLAVSTQPRCIFDEVDPFWAFNTCFSPRQP